MKGYTKENFSPDANGLRQYSSYLWLYFKKNICDKLCSGTSCETYADLPTCTDFRGTYRFWPSITISRFHAVVYRFRKMGEFLALPDFVLFCFRRYSRILPASCTYRQSRRCVAAINSPTNAMNQC